MKTIQEELGNLQSIVKGIAAQFGDKCEVVLHDLTRDYDKTIVAIEHGYITGRQVGDCGSNLGLEVLRGTEKNGNRYNYITHTNQGKILRSSSIYLKDDDGKVIGALCINFDISDLVMAEKTLKSITMDEANPDLEEIFVNDVNDLLNYLIQSCQQQIGKPVIHMSREDKISAIKYLDDKGAFLIKKSGDRICKFLDISKFTLYNYLDEIHANNPGKGHADEMI